MSFLVIASNENTLFKLRSWLKDGYPEGDTIAASTAIEGLQVLQSTGVDLIVVADRTGQVRLCLDIRRFSDAPLLMLGNARRGEAIARTMEAGCDCFLAEGVSSVVFLAHVEALLRRASAGTDPMTQLLNIYSLDRVIAKEMERGRRYQHPFSLMVIDISGLDRLHDGGAFFVASRALRDVAGILKRNVRAADTALRSGPSQFLIVMPEADGNAALKLIGRLQPILNAWCTEQGLWDRGIQVKYGMSAWLPGEERDVAELLRQARRHLTALRRLDSL